MSTPDISSNPWDRVPPQIKPLIQDDSVGFDIHCHIFNFESVPDGFFGIRLPFTQRFFKYLEHFLHKIIGYSDTDSFSNIAYFINFGKNQNTEAIATKLFNYYPEKTIFCPLMMDMQPKKGEGIKGNIKAEYPIQIERMIDLRKQHADKLLPFVAIDPRRPRVFNDIFLKAFWPECHFFGIKIYSSLGYLPSHPELMKIFEVCEEKNIPVVAHCGGASVRSSYHHLQGIKGRRRKDGNYGTEYEDFKEDRWFFRPNSYARYFNDPRNWEPVLHAFPNLRLDLAHFGSDEEWEKLKCGENNTWASRVMDLMLRYDNVYADVSFNIFNHRIFDLIKKVLKNNQLIAERTLYGSEFYMVIIKGHFRSIKVDFTVFMGDRIMKQIASANPRRFLGLNQKNP